MVTAHAARYVFGVLSGRSLLQIVRGFVPFVAGAGALLAACVGSDPDPVTTPEADASTAPFDAGALRDAADGNTEDAGVNDAASEASMFDAGCRGLEDCERVLFVTQNTKTGNLGGATGADAFCTQEANTVGAHARVRGREFVAWISVVEASAAERHKHGTKPYVRPDGTTVANNWTELTSGTIKTNLGIDQFGAGATGSIWTGSAANGSRNESNCVDFKSPAQIDIGAGGTLSATDSAWSLSASFACDSPHRVLCIEK